MTLGALTTERLQRCSLNRWAGDLRRCNWCNKPLRGRQLRWCGKVCSSQYAVNHFWTDARWAALRRDRYQCRCGAPADEVHHVKPLRGQSRHDTCLNHLGNLISLCRAHHLAITHR